MNKETMNIRWQALALCLGSLLLQCCTLAKPEPAFQQVTKPTHTICRLAVLPFTNESGFLNGDLIAYRIFLTEFYRLTNIPIVPEGDVRKILRQLRIGIMEIPSHEQLRIIGDRLNVDAVVLGSIIEMGEQNQDDNDPFLALNLQLVNSRNGQIIATTYHRQTGEQYRKILHFGLVNTITELTQHVSEEIIATWTKEGIKPCAR